ncbi:TBC-domain-containing protein [Zychaea mexicana]|uniref:TBC-domain-containing protein n=1 Tax=Zychaea mexicana TaxID=64656 RepID=UPI0022FDF141|nr:TBC-domain-containing protein [Zychaea mexicana]KAI9485048.1 TBC-domain-containing protein [Zychaea mexicana]
MAESKYLKILNRRHDTHDDIEHSLDELRWVVLSIPCPLELRGWVWKILLRLRNSVSASCYIKLVLRGASAMDTKIRNDTFRTMTTDANFIEHVSEDMLIRVLNAFVWISQQALEQRPTAELTYVQGMNVLAAPFLMVLPEMEAFFAFSTFLWQWCPLYVHPNLKGVHCGLKLVDMCLRVLDPELYGYLLGKGLTANMYAFPSVLTFSACTPPLAEVLRLWDVMLAFGFHLNILYIVAQLQLARDDIIDCPSPMKILRKLPPLKSQAIIQIAVASCKKLPPKLYESLVRHLYDEKVAEDLGVQVAATTNTSRHHHYKK